VGGDGEAQPGAAEAPGGGGVGLLEGPEEARQGLGLDADAGVDDLEAQLQVVSSSASMRARSSTMPFR
jgi:hypothetical protein